MGRMGDISRPSHFFSGALPPTLSSVTINPEPLFANSNHIEWSGHPDRRLRSTIHGSTSSLLNICFFFCYTEETPISHHRTSVKTIRIKQMISVSCLL